MADKVVVVLDRYQVWQSEIAYGPGALRSGRDLIGYPLVIGNTDTPFVNDSARLRSYQLADDAEVVWVSNVDDIRESHWADRNHDGVVDSDRREPAPTFTRLDVDRLVAASLATDDLNGSAAQYDGRQDALTFESSGQVVRLVFSSGC